MDERAQIIPAKPSVAAQLLYSPVSLIHFAFSRLLSEQPANAVWLSFVDLPQAEP
jgi:hypothetical protein